MHKALGCAAGFLLLVLASRISVQIGPVPLTMQTFAVGLVGALLGARRGFLTTAAFVAAGFAGAPVFATPQIGLAAIMGPTAGYLLAFAPAAALAGLLAERGWSAQHYIKSFTNQLAVNLAIVAFGALWLSASVGLTQAWVAGALPFIVPAVLKAVLASAVLYAGSQLK